MMATNQNIIIELSLDGDHLLWVSHTWTVVVGTKPEASSWTQIYPLLSLENKEIFKVATRRLRKDGSSTLRVEFDLQVNPARHDTSRACLQLEGRGMLMMDRKYGRPSHTMWVLRPLATPRLNLESPTHSLETFGSNVEVGCCGTGADLIWCRVCECRVPKWYFQKHGEMCLEVHHLETEIARGDKEISELQNTIRNLRTAVDRASPIATLSYRGMPILLPSTALLRFKSARQIFILGKVWARKVQRLVEKLEDILTVVSEVSVSSLSPTSRERLSSICDGCMPTFQDAALRWLVADAQRAIHQKIDNLARVQNFILYAERIWCESTGLDALDYFNPLAQLFHDGGQVLARRSALEGPVVNSTIPFPLPSTPTSSNDDTRASSDSDDFGSFHFKNLLPLKKANDDLIFKFRGELGRIKPCSEPVGLSQRLGIPRQITKPPSRMTTRHPLTITTIPTFLTSTHSSNEPQEYRAEVDRIFFEYLNRICSDRVATDLAGEPIHQLPMAKEMQRLDESPDFRPFKFHIKAFTHAFSEELARQGYPEDKISTKNTRQYLWEQPYISRFNEDGKEHKDMGNHSWIIEARGGSGMVWEFRPFHRKIAGALSEVAYCGSLWSWTPCVWDPHASLRGIPVRYSFPSFPSWLSWQDGVLSGVPPPGAQSCRITAKAKYILNGQQERLTWSFKICIPPIPTTDSSPLPGYLPVAKEFQGSSPQGVEPSLQSSEVSPRAVRQAAHIHNTSPIELDAVVTSVLGSGSEGWDLYLGHNSSHHEFCPFD